MRQPVNTTKINPDLCNGCGECVRVCPTESIQMQNSKAVVTGQNSNGCGHCVAVCPTLALTISFTDEKALELSTIKGADGYIKPGEFDKAALVKLMRSRRSCRNYQDRPVEPALLDDLIRIGITAPTGTNSQLWTFSVFPDRLTVEKLGIAVGNFFRKLNRMAKNPLLRFLSKIFMKDALGQYYREYYETVKEGLRQWDQEGRDRLFHGATAVLVVGSKPGASCPIEDALLATQNILLAAHALGLGSCLVGFVTQAFQNDPAIKLEFGIPRNEKIHSVIALGYPDESYLHPAGRKRVEPRWIRI